MWKIDSLDDFIPILSLSSSNLVIVSDTPEKNRACLETVKLSIEEYLEKREMEGKVRIIGCSSEEDINGLQEDLLSLENEYGKPRWGNLYEVINELKNEDTGTGAFYYIPIYHELHKMPDWDVPDKDMIYTWKNFMNDTIYATYNKGIPFILSMDKESHKQARFAGGAGSRTSGYRCLVLD
ncbi:hypothetical protein GQ472_03805 [archaeon]|nr:hypothetical protein [archaeon]